MAVKRKRWPYVLGGVVVLLVAAVGIVVWRLDAILLRTARAQAATWSKKLDRPISVGDVSATLFPALGARVKAVSVGPAKGEKVPLAQVGSVEVSVMAWPLLTSGGKDIQVKNVAVKGLVVSLVRSPDGTTNLQRLRQKVAAATNAQEPAKRSAASEEPTDLSGVRIDRVALNDGKVELLDRTKPHAAPLAIRDIDLEVKGVRVGQPVVAKLSAAVLAQNQNLHLTLTTAPMPKSFVPTPVEVTLSSEPIDLAPLAPFLPGLGLRTGTVEASWKAELGGAVPGGTGPTKLSGSIHARNLRFADAEGGKPLDVALETDLSADVTKGDLSIRKLHLAVGDARLDGKGRLAGLLSGAPKVEGFSLTGRDIDPARLARHDPSLRRMLAGRISGPIGFSLTGEGTQAKPVLTLAVDLTPVRLRVPGQLTKATGRKLSLTAHLSGAPKGAVRFRASADLDGVDLRPGLLLNKAPGQRMAFDLVGTAHVPGGGRPLKVALSSLTAHLLKDTVTGKASFERSGKHTRFDLTLKSAHLDADRLLMADTEKSVGKGGKLPVPVEDPHRFDGMRGDIHAEVAALRYEQMDLSHLTTDVKMVDDRITVEKLSTGLFGGTITADGTSIALGPPPTKRPFDAKVVLKNVDVRKALATTTSKPVASGTFSGSVDVHGVGYTADRLKKTLLGSLSGQVKGGSLLGIDLLSAVTGPLAKALPFAGRALKGHGVTSLGDVLPFGVQIEKGVAQLKKPITWTRPQAAVRLDGGIGLDGMLHLAGTVALTPATIQALTRGKVTPKAPIPVALKLGGMAWAPKVVALDLKPAVEQIARQAAGGLAKKYLHGKAGKIAGKVLGGTGAASSRQAVQKKAAEERTRLRNQAKTQEHKALNAAKNKLRSLFGH